MLKFYRSRTPRGPNPSTGGLGRFIAGEVASYALHGILAPISSPARRGAAAAGTAEATILFVHGHGGGPGAFLLMERALRRRGFGRFSSYAYRSTGSIASLAEGLARHAAEVAGPLHVVGHSLGGVIARLWLQELGGRARAVSFTTLSSPHQGLAGVPAAGLVPVIRDLLPGSPTLARLEQGAGALDGLPCLSLVSSRDHFVRPWQRAAFAGARLHPVAEAGHVGLLFSREVAGLVADHLESAGS